MSEKEAANIALAFGQVSCGTAAVACLPASRAVQRLPQMWVTQLLFAQAQPRLVKHALESQPDTASVLLVSPVLLPPCRAVLCYVVLCRAMLYAVRSGRQWQAGLE